MAPTEARAPTGARAVQQAGGSSKRAPFGMCSQAVLPWRPPQQGMVKEFVRDVRRLEADARALAALGTRLSRKLSVAELDNLAVQTLSELREKQDANSLLRASVCAARPSGPIGGCAATNVRAAGVLSRRTKRAATAGVRSDRRTS